MISANDGQAADGAHQSTLASDCGQYEPSTTSSIRSSQASVFSDSGSTQSSIASSISDDFRQSYEESHDAALAKLRCRTQLSCGRSSGQAAQHEGASSCNAPSAVRSYADITSASAQQRQHPRRSSLARGQKPPALQKQECRKFNFVESLVDSATQMLEVIWPLSAVHCKVESSGGRGVLPLRTYIEETLRRSLTSYSTLQVALYYVILIKPHVPKHDFTQEQLTNCPASRALICGRRMFLAALILASKYLQDRNYSAKAWSKMSGLRISEINANERIFLEKVNWKLHIPELIYKRWTDVVLRYAPNPRSPPPGQGLCFPTANWQSIVPLLTPELDNIPLAESMPKSAVICPQNYGFVSSDTPKPSVPTMSTMKLGSCSSETTPTPITMPPRFLEPAPNLAPPTPALARMGPLPTPQMTPSSVASNTPAASARSSRRPSMCSAMSTAQDLSLNRCTVDVFPSDFASKANGPFGYRRPSVTSMTSSRSSPESTVSDISRCSRASSISSISTSSMAPKRACLARQATCRNARLPMPPATVSEEKEGTAQKPIFVSDDVEMTTSDLQFIDFRPNAKVLSRPDRHSKHAPQPTSAPTSERSRKRGRPHGGNRRSDLQEEVRIQLVDFQDEMVDVEADDSDDYVPSSLAVDYAGQLLSPTNSRDYTKAAQPPTSPSSQGSGRMSVQRCDSAKRACRAVDFMSTSPTRLYHEVA